MSWPLMTRSPAATLTLPEVTAAPVTLAAMTSAVTWVKPDCELIAAALARAPELARLVDRLSSELDEAPMAVPLIAMSPAVNAPPLAAWAAVAKARAPRAPARMSLIDTDSV